MTKQFICAVLFFLALQAGVVPFAAAAEDPSREEEAIFIAEKAFTDGFYDVSLELLERFIKKYPGSPKLPQVNLLVGQCYFHQNKFVEALNKFEWLLNQPAAADIKDSVVYWIAEVHFKGNNFERSAAYYKMLVDEFPRSSYVPAGFYSLGWCYFQENKLEQSMQNFLTVEEKYPGSPQAQDATFKIIECLYGLKDYAALRLKAGPQLKECAKDPSRLSYLYFYIAEADYYLNDFAEAINNYSKAASVTQDERLQSLARLGIGWSRLKLKLYVEAESAFGQVARPALQKKSLDVLLLGEALLYSETSRLDSAQKIYGELVSSCEDPLVLMQAYLGRADAFYNLGDYQSAVDTYKEALVKAQPLTVPAEISDKLHYGLAWAYLKKGDFKEAIKEFQMIARSSDDKIIKVSALCQIGDAYQDSGDYTLAQEAYDSILKDYPDNFYSDYVQYQLGLVLLKNSNYDGAILAFLNVKKNFPQSKILDEAAYGLGLAYFQKMDYESSRDIFSRFQNEFGSSNKKPQALYLLGTSLYNLGKYDLAIGAFKDIIRGYSQDTELVQKAEYEIADCFYQMGNEKEAMNRFKALRSKYPDSSLTDEIVWWLGEYYYRHNDLELARRYFTSLINDFSKSGLVVDAYYALASSYEAGSLHQEALENFKKVVEMGKSELSGQAAAAIADIYAKLGDTEPALREYKGVVADYPNLSASIYPKMGDIYFKMGSYNQALEMFKKSLDIVSVKEMPGLQLKIAEVLEASGKADEAIEEYLKVTYLYPQDAALAAKPLLRVAKIYEDRENFKEAANIYKRIVALNTDEAKFANERIEWIKARGK
ncbi:MAG: tetratricopeptide repeat protein [Candidatus Omnitrophota bacterium]|nr:tetratricopeptide repeat protein [Candidatus Omnitrophota bacterium]